MISDGCSRPFLHGRVSLHTPRGELCLPRWADRDEPTKQVLKRATAGKPKMGSH